MCGICGIVDFSDRLVEPERLQRMTETLQHRGPDAQGIAVWNHAGFGHTRLSILDLTAAGNQPMKTPDERLAISYNGEVYNYRELQQRLRGLGVSFQSGTDTEVVLQSWQRWGAEALSLFNGMFAFAVWEPEHDRLTLARDRFGIKPLYYYELEEGLIFASEIKALLAAGVVAQALNWQALHEYLYYGNPIGSGTLFAGVNELPPGHYLTLQRSGLTLRPYWSVEHIQRRETDSFTATARLRELLEAAVQAHLVSDVPVGVFLSGGVDSSIIAALACRHYGRKLQTFSAGFDFASGVNELPKARRVAEFLGTDHHEFRISSADVAEVIERLVWHHDQPFGDAANIPLYLMCRELQGSVRVMLQGDGGDEVFAGYRRYSALGQSGFWLAAARLGNPLLRVLPGGITKDRVTRFLTAMGESDPGLRMALLLTTETLANPPTRVLTRAARQQLSAEDPFARYRELNQRLRLWDLRQRMLYTDCTILLPKTFLEKVDRATMAHSVEARVPLLDVNLTNYAMALPSVWKARGLRNKWILKRAASGLVPDSILYARKTGFGVPYAHWLRTALKDFLRAALLDPSTLRQGLLDEDAVIRCLDEHLRGSRNHGLLLYKLLQLALWMNSYLHTAPAGDRSRWRARASAA